MGKVLVIDDGDAMRQSLIDVLELEGFETIGASSGEQGLQILADDSPDVVLLDVMMPGLNGLQTLEAIRANPATAELPVVMVTALDEPTDVVQGLELGANDYLTKPPQYEILVARVRTQIKIKRLQDQRRLDLARLRELDALKDKFLQIAAHDLKNPINNIGLGLSLLSKGETTVASGSPEYERVIQLMEDATSTMQVIVNDFLDLQAMHAGKVELDRRPVLLNALIERVVRQYQPYAENKSISVQGEFADDLPEYQADADRLMQVLSNLVSNAIKFSPAGATVVVRSRVGNVGLRVEVQDNGPGIPDEDRAQLFQEFARLANKPTGGEKSSGLGLAIARHLVELHGGQIGADSQIGQGSVFWFELPLAAG
jgi:signal transduction histidine kinase